MNLWKKLFASRTEIEMDARILELAMSKDFQIMLYHLGFLSDNTNAVQIIRQLMSGPGADFIQHIIRQIGHLTDEYQIRLLLQQLLSIRNVQNWIGSYGGANVDITLRNWRQFVDSLNISRAGWDVGGPSGYGIKGITGMTDNTYKMIYDYWYDFVNRNGLTGPYWDGMLRYTISGRGKNGHLQKEWLNEMIDVVRDKTIRDKWLGFLNKQNFSVTFDTQGWEVHKGNGGPEIGNHGATGWNYWLKWVQKSVGPRPDIGISDETYRIIYDYWYDFVNKHGMTGPEWNQILRYTIDGLGQNGHLNKRWLIEMVKTINDKTIRDLWLDFLNKKNNGIDFNNKGWNIHIGGKGGWDAWIRYLLSLYGDGSQGKGNGISDHTYQKLYQYWYDFVNKHGMTGPEWSKILHYTIIGLGKDGHLNKQWLLELINTISDKNIRDMWLNFLNTQNAGISRGMNGWEIQIGGRGGWNTFINYLLNLFGTGTNKGDETYKLIYDYWYDFINKQGMTGPEWQDVLRYTIDGMGKNGHINKQWLIEMINTIKDKNIQDLWIRYLNNKNAGIVRGIHGWEIQQGGKGGWNLWLEWISRLFGSTERTNSGLTYMTDETYKMMYKFWFDFVNKQGMTGPEWRRLLRFTLTGMGKNGHLNKQWFLEMINTITKDKTIRNKWLNYLKTINSGISIGTRGWEIQLGDQGGWDSWINAVMTIFGTGTHTGDETYKMIYKFWYDFVNQQGMTTGEEWNNILRYTITGMGKDGHVDKQWLLELVTLIQDRAIQTRWINFLNTQNAGISYGKNGWEIQIGGRGGWNIWVNWLVHLFGRQGPSTGTYMSDDAYRLIYEFWYDFVINNGMSGAEWNNFLRYTLSGLGQNGHLNKQWIIEMVNIIKQDINIRNRWLEFLQMKMVGITFDIHGWVIQPDIRGGWTMWLNWIINFFSNQGMETDTITIDGFFDWLIGIGNSPGHGDVGYGWDWQSTTSQGGGEGGITSWETTVVGTNVKGESGTNNVNGGYHWPGDWGSQGGSGGSGGSFFYDYGGNGGGGDYTAENGYDLTGTVNWGYDGWVHTPGGSDGDIHGTSNTGGGSKNKNNNNKGGAKGKYIKGMSGNNGVGTNNSWGANKYNSGRMATKDYIRWLTSNKRRNAILDLKNSKGNNSYTDFMSRFGNHGSTVSSGSHNFVAPTSSGNWISGGAGFNPNILLALNAEHIDIDKPGQAMILSSLFKRHAPNVHTAVEYNGEQHVGSAPGHGGSIAGEGTYMLL